MSLNGSFLSSPSHMAGARSEMLHISNTHQSKTWSLPSELISIIFQHACPTPNIFIWKPTPQPPFHLTLRLVSTLWYYIVQTTPQLWTSVILPNLRADNLDTHGRYLKLCLDNSGRLPLTLSFRFHLGLRRIDRFISPIVDATLEHNTLRIRALHLFQPPRTWLEYLIPNMGQLAMICIQNPPPFLANLMPQKHPHSLFLPNNAPLSRIFISYPHLSDFRLECVTTSITHVELYKIPIDFAMEILLRCPNLIDFSCLRRQAASKVKTPHTILSSPLVLSHLSTFTWSTTQFADGVSEWDTVVFDYIHFPALKRFNWRPDGCIPVENTTLALSLSRFPKSLNTLELGDLDICSPEDNLGMEMFIPLTGIIQLRLLHCGRAFMERTLSVLSHKTDGVNMLFPKLTCIAIKYRATERGISSYWAEFGRESGKKLVQMLRSRIGLMDEFTLTVGITPLTQYWDDEVWHTLRELKRNGLDLTIIECGHPIII